MNKVVSDFIMALTMSCLSAWILREYLETFLEKEKYDWLSKMRWIIFIAWQICSTLDSIIWPEYCILVINVLAVFIVTFNYDEGHLLKKMLFVTVYNSIWVLMEVLTAFIFIIIRWNYTVQGLLGSLLSKVFLFILVETLKYFLGNKKIKDLPHSYNMILVLIPLGSMFVVYTSFLMSIESLNLFHIIWSFASLVIMLLINILIFTLYLKLSEDLELRQKNVIYKQEIDLYSKYIEEKENSMLEFRKIKHDLKNQLIFMLERCEKKEYKELREFLEQLIEKAPFDNLTISKTDNTVVDALVNYKYGIARRFGITFSVKLDIPMRLPFDDVDICIILGNALDNALEANVRSKIENHFITLKIRMEHNNLAIVVKNSFDGNISRDKKGKLQTIKTNKIEHGLGLDSIQKAVNKYHGFMKIEIAKQVFCVEILLYNE